MFPLIWVESPFLQYIQDSFKCKTKFIPHFPICLGKPQYTPMGYLSMYIIRRVPKQNMIQTIVFPFPIRNDPFGCYSHIFGQAPLNESFAKSTCFLQNFLFLMVTSVKCSLVISELHVFFGWSNNS